MKKLLALTISFALLLTAVAVPFTATAAETLAASAEITDWDGRATVSASGQYIRPKALEDGTVGAAWYQMGDGGYYGVSYDGGMTFRGPDLSDDNAKTPVRVVENTYEADRGTNDGYGRLEVQNPNFIEMADGTLLYTYRYNTFISDPANKPWTTYYTSIRYQLSTDGGKTWGEPQIIKESAQPNDGSDEEHGHRGYWEPEPVYIGSDLYIYWCDTVTYENLGFQNILGAKWNGSGFDASFIAVDGKTNNSREGMCVVTKLSDGTYAMVFESTDTDDNVLTDNVVINDGDNYTFVIKMARSADGVNWSSPVTVAKPEVTVTDADADGALAVCASPYIITLPDGRVAVSYQTTDLYTGDVTPRKGGSQERCSGNAF